MQGPDVADGALGGVGPGETSQLRKAKVKIFTDLPQPC
jgi:hypothetical protein